MKTFRNHREKNECICQFTHVQNHSYANKSRHMYVCDVHQLLNTDESIIVGSALFSNCVQKYTFLWWMGHFTMEGTIVTSHCQF